MAAPRLLRPRFSPSSLNALLHAPALIPLSRHASASVNPAEVSHFRQLASSWWDPHGPSRLLHLMNPLRHDFVSACLSSSTRSSQSSSKLRYLDVGCGGGIFAESAARLAHTSSVTAIDPTANVLRVAQQHAARDPVLCEAGKLEYLHASLEDLPVPTSLEAQYDVLALWEVVEHVRYPAPFLQLCARFVKPGGWLVLSTIARAWTSWLTTKLVAEDVLGIVPRGTHEWENYVNPNELTEFFFRQPGWGGQGAMKVAGCVYLPALGWKMVPGSEDYGNYFFGIRRNPLKDEGIK